MKASTLTTVALVSFLALAPAAEALEMDNAIVIESESTREPDQLVISGRDFGTVRGIQLTLGGTPLELLEQTSTVMLAEIPLNVLPGNYVLIAWSGRGTIREDSMDVTIGAVGPAGPQGLRGPRGFRGATGAQGPAGPQGVQGPTGPQGDQGLPGWPGHDGAPGADGTDGADGESCWDLNGNGRADLTSEDVNRDRVVNARDCAGPRGPAGPQGPEGPAGPGAAAGPYGGVPIRRGDTHEIVGSLLIANASVDIGIGGARGGATNEAVMFDSDVRYFVRFVPNFTDGNRFQLIQYPVNDQFADLSNPIVSFPANAPSSRSIHFEYEAEVCNGPRALQVPSANWIANRLGLTAVFGLWADGTVATPATSFTSRSTGTLDQDHVFTCMPHAQRTQLAMPLVPVDTSFYSNVYLDLTP